MSFFPINQPMAQSVTRDHNKLQQEQLFCFLALIKQHQKWLNSLNHELGWGPSKHFISCKISTARDWRMELIKCIKMDLRIQSFTGNLFGSDLCQCGRELILQFENVNQTKLLTVWTFKLPVSSVDIMYSHSTISFYAFTFSF